MSDFYNNSIFWVEVDRINPNPYQPRREFDTGKIKELADSIKQYGVLQPLVVTRKETEREDGGISVEYELIAGERRLRASKIAGVPQVPVIIRAREETNKEKLELAIIENLQREDLNAIDRARAFKQLVEEFNMRHADVAKKVGKSREYVSNTLRLLSLPTDMQSALIAGMISEGHARPLLMLNDREEEQKVLFKEITSKKLTVRESEKIARRIATDKTRKQDLSPELLGIEKKLEERLGTKVYIEKRTNKEGGKVHIDYFSEEDLARLLDILSADKVKNVDRIYNPELDSGTTNDTEDAVNDIDKVKVNTPLVDTVVEDFEDTFNDGDTHDSFSYDSEEAEYETSDEVGVSRSDMVAEDKKMTDDDKDISSNIDFSDLINIADADMEKEESTKKDNGIDVINEMYNIVMNNNELPDVSDWDVDNERKVLDDLKESIGDYPIVPNKKNADNNNGSVKDSKESVTSNLNSDYSQQTDKNNVDDSEVLVDNIDKNNTQVENDEVRDPFADFIVNNNDDKEEIKESNTQTRVNIKNSINPFERLFMNKKDTDFNIKDEDGGVVVDKDTNNIKNPFAL